MVSSSSHTGSTSDHYDAIIIGSGFGGSVMAYRLAQAGLSVCLLERGKLYPPSSFARSPYEMKRNFWDPSEGLYGLFNIWSFRQMDAIVSSGVGGGSLVYANVLLRKDEQWFVKEDLKSGGIEYWPIQRSDLEPHYDRVEAMLKAQPYPFDKPPYNQTAKTKALQSAAAQLHLNWHLPNLAITFANPGKEPVPGEPIEEKQNLHDGSTRSTCRLCGECYIGCNYGSKNTLDYNYLSEAQKLRAQIKHLCEVRSFEPRDAGGYAVHYVQHDLNHEGSKLNTNELPSITITTEQLVLAAGTFGSTYLLLKNKQFFPHISPQLGTRFCGNGDLLGYAARCTQRNSDGRYVPRLIDSSNGPSITSAIRIPDQVEGGQGRGFYIEDVGYPELVDWVIQVLDTPNALWRWRLILFRLLREWLRWEPESDLSAEIAGLLGTTALSSSSLPLLGIGHDIPNGKMQLRGKKLDIDWRQNPSSPYYVKVRQTMQRLTDVLGGRFRDNFTWRLKRQITGHPLGGCPMGRTVQEGVVNSYGEVFNYPGFYIADGSVLPGPVGANPSLTIAALADRFAERVITRHQQKNFQDEL